jgi:hypothetical protein
MGAVILNRSFIEKVDEDLSNLFKLKKIAAIDKGGFILEISEITYNNNAYIFHGNLHHTHFSYFPIEISGKYLGVLEKTNPFTVFGSNLQGTNWKFGLNTFDMRSELKKYYSKPLKPHFNQNNIDFKIEYWTTHYSNFTIFKIQFNSEFEKERLENYTQEFFDTILKWDSFISNYSDFKILKKQLPFFQLDDEAFFKIKTIDSKTLKIHLAFNEFECYWSAEWYLRWLSYSLPSQIDKITFEWVF